MNGLQNVIKIASKSARGNSSAILLGAAVAGVIATALLSAKGAIKAKELIEENMEAINDSETETKYRLEIVKTALPAFAPAIVSGVATVGFMVLSHRVQSKRLAALASVYTLSETAYKEYRSQVRHAFGDKKKHLLSASVNDKKLQASKKPRNEIMATDGDTLSYDALSGRYFRTYIDSVRRGIAEANKQMFLDDWISLNDVYDCIGLPPIELGDMMGWSIDNGPIEEDFTSHLKDDVPVLVIDFRVEPKYTK